ncbi:MAG: MFS transporter [Deltaproteobacteria bacterium]|nr:MFS transporter [Candidatus Zymogenaceae bacterium]
MKEHRPATTEAAKNPADDRLSTRMKLGYGVGDLSFNIAYQATALYLIFFFTDVFGIAAGVAGMIMFYSKIWDAVSDPMMGYICDHTKSRWGSKRPYILLGAIPLGVTFMLVFYSPSLGSENLKVIYGLVTFVLFCTAITIVNVPYGALTADMTLDSKERSVVTGYRMSFAIFGTLVAAGATLPLVGLLGNGDQVLGFRYTGIVYGILIMVVLFITFFTVKERVAHPKEEVLSFMENLRVITSNKPFLILAAGTISHVTAVLTTAAVVNYYFKYNLKNEAMIPVAFMCLFVTAIAFMPLFVKLATKKSKKYAYNLGIGSFAVVLVLIFFFGEKNIYLTLFLFFLGAAGMAANWLSSWSMVPDTVEYSQWKTGLRREGLIYGAFMFCQKFPAALAAFIVGLVLSHVGYTANIEQTEQSLMGIRLLLTLIPVGFIIIGIVLISLFPIDAEMHGRMLDEIRQREESKK